MKTGNRKKRKPESAILIAYHEAGHAVVAWKLGAKLKRQGVDIVRKGGRAGQVHAFEPILRRIPTSLAKDCREMRLWFEKRAMISMAGFVTEGLGRPSPDGIFWGGSDYRNGLFSIDSLLIGTKKTRMAEVHRVGLRTANLLARNWFRVKALAKALVEERKISGRKATRIIETARKRGARHGNKHGN